MRRWKYKTRRKFGCWRPRGRSSPRKGYECARIRTICERAQANIAAVNYHFGDKEQLYVEAVLDAHRCGFEESGGEEEGPVEPAEQLRAFIHHFLCHVLAVQRPGRLAASPDDPGDAASHGRPRTS